MSLIYLPLQIHAVACLLNKSRDSNDTLQQQIMLNRPMSAAPRGLLDAGALPHTVTTRDQKRNNVQTRLLVLLQETGVTLLMQDLLLDLLLDLLQELLLLLNLPIASRTLHMTILTMMLTLMLSNSLHRGLATVSKMVLTTFSVMQKDTAMKKRNKKRNKKKNKKKNKKMKKMRMMRMNRSLMMMTMMIFPKSMNKTKPLS